MFDTDLVMKVGECIGQVSDESSELLYYLDKLKEETDFKAKTRNEIAKEVKLIEQSLANITMILSSELQGE